MPEVIFGIVIKNYDWVYRSNSIYWGKGLVAFIFKWTLLWVWNTNLWSQHPLDFAASSFIQRPTPWQLLGSAGDSDTVYKYSQVVSLILCSNFQLLIQPSQKFILLKLDISYQLHNKIFWIHAIYIFRFWL